MDHMTLDDYRKLVEQVMRETLSAGTEATPRVFTNIGNEHACVVVSTMLDYAQSNLCVYSQKLSSDVWPADKVRSFLARVPNAVVRIIVDQADALDASDSALSQLRAEVEAGKITVRQAAEGQLPAHICIADGRHIRLEQDAKLRKATVVFGDAELGNSALHMFDKCWSRSGVTPVTHQ